jgi:hypothetical protein
MITDILAPNTPIASHCTLMQTDSIKRGIF